MFSNKICIPNVTGLIRAGLKSKVTPPPLRSPLLRADPRQGERVRSIPSIIYTLSGCPAAGSPGTDLVWQPGKKRGKEGRATRGGLPLPSLPPLSLSAGQLHPHPLERASERSLTRAPARGPRLERSSALRTVYQALPNCQSSTALSVREKQKPRLESG